MFIVRNSSEEIVAICTREEDAQSFQNSSSVDKEFYTVEDTNLTEYFLQLEDGYGEGQCD